MISVSTQNTPSPIPVPLGPLGRPWSPLAGYNADCSTGVVASKQGGFDLHLCKGCPPVTGYVTCDAIAARRLTSPSPLGHCGTQTQSVRGTGSYTNRRQWLFFIATWPPGAWSREPGARSGLGASSQEHGQSAQAVTCRTPKRAVSRIRVYVFTRFFFLSYMPRTTP